jgi:hypothetical protein
METANVHHNKKNLISQFGIKPNQITTATWISNCVIIIIYNDTIKKFIMIFYISFIFKYIKQKKHFSNNNNDNNEQVHF